MRTLLLFLARQEGFKNLAMNLGFFRQTASRFVAGETLPDAIGAVHQANRQNMRGLLDLLGENTLTLEDAAQALQEISASLDAIQAEKAACSISIKLTQLGLALDPEAALRNLLAIAEHARKLNNFVWVDMEESRYTQSTLDIVSQAYSGRGNVGAVIQAYLFRSEQDILRLMHEGIPIRLVKGAYLESKAIAFQKKSETDANFLKLMQMLLSGNTFVAIATHDEAIIKAATESIRSKNISPDRFEFQMLYGIRRDLQSRLAREGYGVRIYIPYGKRWYAYFMRRLAERPANLGFFLRSFLRG